MKSTKTVKDSILAVTHGSHAYGLNTPESDLDIRGILVEPVEEFITYRAGFEQVQQHAHDGFTEDLTLFGLRKFAKLAADSNPNVIEIVFVEPTEILYKTKHGQTLIDNRDLFLSKKIFHTFGGYAKSQLSRLEGHRRWIRNPPTPPISREEFGLPSKPVIDSDAKKSIFASITKKLDSWNLKDLTDEDSAERIQLINAVTDMLAEMQMGNDEKWWAAGKVLGLDSNIIEILNKERNYENLHKEYSQYLSWQKNRNLKRYETEVKCGCDTKHASHLVRLYYQAIDALKGNSLILKRPILERQLLLDIKQGKFEHQTYDLVMDTKAILEKELQEAYTNSKLPANVDQDKLDSIIRDIYLESWFGMNREQISIAEVLLRNR